MAISTTTCSRQGTLSLDGRKGGRTLGRPRNSPSTGTTTVLDLMDFMTDAMGIQTPPGTDPLNPIPQSQTDGAPVNPGGSVTSDGRIRLIGNNGVDNAIAIGLGAMQLTTASGHDSINLPFGSTQEAVGQSAVSDFIVYDSLGIPLNVRVTAVLRGADRYGDDLSLVRRFGRQLAYQPVRRSPSARG